MTNKYTVYIAACKNYSKCKLNTSAEWNLKFLKLKQLCAISGLRCGVQEAFVPWDATQH